MKQNLQTKLDRYTKSISQQSIDPSKIKKLGLTSAAAMAAMVTVPVELNSQVVCGDQGAPTRTTLQCVDDLAYFNYTSFCAQFDFDGDGTDELQVRYNNYNGIYPWASMYVDPLTTQFWTVELSTYFNYANFPETPTLRTDAWFTEVGDKLHIYPLSSGTGFGFIAFDGNAHLWTNGTPHPTTGQPNNGYHNALPYMWGSTLDPDFVTNFVANSVNEVITCASVGLPVELSSFEATAKENAILLDWTTESEVNNAGFAIERSMDGKDFSEIAFVDGEGESSKTVSYKFEDSEIKAGNNYYYRLRQIDFDGRSELSEVLRVATLSKDLDFTLSPNPSSDHINIQLSANNEGMATIEIINISGQSLKTERVDMTKGQNDFKLDINELSQGIYFVKLNDGLRSTFKKLIVN